MVSDAELVRAAQGGEVACLGELLERHRAPLYAVALGILGHGPRAQDAVHDTFLVALRKIGQVREPAAVGGWLRATLRNVCLMKLREDRGEVPFEELPRTVRSGSFEASVDEHIERLAVRDWVWTALAALPEDLRVTVILRYFGSNCTYEEISAVLGVPLGTVRSRLNAVRARLAEALLQTAGLAHADARRVSESRARFFDAAYDEYSRGRGYGILAGALSRDLTVGFSDGTGVARGYEFMIEDMEWDLEAGVRIHPTQVLASEGVAVVECDVTSPPDDPFHCPPAFTQVFFYRGDDIARMRWHLAPRSGNHPEETAGEPWTPEGVERRLRAPEPEDVQQA